MAREVSRNEKMPKIKKFGIDENFVPCPVNDGDELYPNGIFVFNITKMIEYIKKNPADIALETVAVEDFCGDFSSFDESHVDSVDVSQPVVMAEISPGRYNLIDGNHRMQKARITGVKSVSAYKLNVTQHMKFLTTKRGYKSYIEYWNSKLKQQ